MTRDLDADAAALLVAAQGIYFGDPIAGETLRALEHRLQEPLRVAVAGIVKAGKSTLLNALLGERIAPTDAGECTRVVTWYRYADTPSITAYLVGGAPRRLPIKRHGGQLILELGELAAEDVDRIEIGWPSQVLKSVILIDTPGIASLSRGVSVRSTDFLAPENAPSSADAIVYLMRHLHPTDVGFLEAFRDTAAGSSRTVNAIAVLSRADEVGSGRIDSLLSAGKVAHRYEQDGGLASLALGVIPVAGLLAEGARTLRESEFAAFRTLAGLERRERERLLVSADRFVQPNDAVELSQQTRRELLERFGIFGVRLAVSLLRAGATDSSDLSERMVQYSGLNDLRQFVELQFGPRTAVLKLRNVLDGLERLIRERPVEGLEVVEEGIERLRLASHDLRELSLLSQARVPGLPLESTDSAAAIRIVGGAGTSPSARLGLPAESDGPALWSKLVRELDEWRARSQSPIAEREGVEVCRVVIRSLEELALSLPIRNGEAGHAELVVD